ncbi:spermatogenesis-associated protein 25 [Thamnophis elegans]|uniref:spermatogenesis-associated protein 25 n=1 Tax=Thamnophis elegans TaxID=35005 RepID=UPI001376875E|nr:spermatogenesis-associated protein 25 [Thamnophis elegans]
MAFCGGLEKASSASFAPSHQGEPAAGGNSSSSSSSIESKEAPRSRLSSFAWVPHEAPPSAGIPCCPVGLLRRKPQAKQTPPLQGGATQLPMGPSLAHSCPALGALQQGSTDPWDPSRGSCCRRPLQNVAQEFPLEHPADRWLYLPSGPPQPPQQQQPQPPSSGGDFALAQWGFLPSGGVFVMSAKLNRERDAQPRLPWPPNICILSLAMMIAGIPTVPVPGVREEDMIHAAQCFMAENLEPGEGPAEGAPRRQWAAFQRLGSSFKRDRQRRRATHRSLLPLFLAQLEK